MPNPIESEQREQPVKMNPFIRVITSWQFWLSGIAGLGGTTAVVAIGRAMLGDADKHKISATEEIPGGQLPSTPISEEVSGEVVFTPIPKELPTPTAIKTPEPTATFIPAKPTEVLPAPATEPLKPSHEQTFSTGAVEKYDLVTEKNFDQVFIKESKEEFKQTEKEQSDRLLFPFSPKGVFSISEFTGSSGYNTLQIYSSDCDVYAPIKGTVRLNITKQYSTIEITSSEKADDGSYLVTTFSANNPQLELTVAQGDQAKKSNKLFHFSGSDPVAYNPGPGNYTAEKNQLSFKVERRTDLNPPIVTILPNGGKMTKKIDIKIITPLLQDLDEWETKNGKFVVPE